MPLGAACVVCAAASAGPPTAICWLDEFPLVDGWVEDIVVLDLNADGLPDVLYQDGASGEFGAALSDGAGGFVPLAPASIAGPDDPFEVLQAKDLDGDGDDDLLLQKSVWFNTTPAGTPIGPVAMISFAESSISLPANADVHRVWGAEDLDGDGVAELLILDGHSRQTESQGRGGDTACVWNLYTLTGFVCRAIPGQGSGTPSYETIASRVILDSREPAFDQAGCSGTVGLMFPITGQSGQVPEQVAPNSVVINDTAYVTLQFPGRKSGTNDLAAPLLRLPVNIGGIGNFKLLLDPGSTRSASHAVGDFLGIGGTQVFAKKQHDLTLDDSWMLFDLETGSLIDSTQVASATPAPPVDWNLDGLPDLPNIINDGSPGFPLGEGGIHLLTDTVAWADFNSDGYPDRVERRNKDGQQSYIVVLSGPTPDYNADGVGDACQPTPDENGNGRNDWEEIWFGDAPDCNGNFRLDSAEIAAFTEWDCNQNGLPDSCERDRLPSLDLNGDGVLDDCVPAYRVRDLEAMLGIGPHYSVTDISDSGLLVAWSNPVNVHILDLHTGARHDYQIPDTIAARFTSINNHGEFASASDVGNETVVWAGVVGEPGVREVARIEHDAVRSLYYSRPYGLSDAGVILIEANSDRAFSNDVWQNRILAVNIRTGSVATARAAHQYPKAVFPDGRLVLRKYGPFTPGRVRITTTSFTVLDEYFPPDWNNSHPSRYWEIERSGASATGAVAMSQQRTSNQFSNSPVLVLPSRAEVPRRIEFVGLGDEDNFDQGAWISDCFTMVAYEYQSVPRAWPTPEQPSVSYPVNELITENPDGVPIDSGNTAGFAEKAGVSGPGVFADDWNDLIYEPLLTSPPGLDLTADGLADDADLLALVEFLAGQGPQPAGDADLNQDGSIDEEDAQALAWWLIASRAGTLPDCDGDGTPDLAQLARFGGTLPDADNDLVPDGCVPSGCNLADLVPPLGLHDLADVVAFVDGFAAGDTALDFDGSGLLDLADIVAFVTAFGAGCP